jgi:hypothetical protein
VPLGCGEPRYKRIDAGTAGMEAGIKTTQPRSASSEQVRMVVREKQEAATRV